MGWKKRQHSRGTCAVCNKKITKKNAISHFKEKHSFNYQPLCQQNLTQPQSYSDSDEEFRDTPFTRITVSNPSNKY